MRFGPIHEPVARSVLSGSDSGSEAESDESFSHELGIPAESVTMAEGGDILQLREEQNQRFTEKWKTQTIALAKIVEDATKPPTGPPKYNSVKLATFSGSFNEDVNEFLTNFERAATFHGWETERKGQTLPLHLKDNASTGDLV